MKDRTLKILLATLSLGLFVTLVIKLTTVPGGMILSGLFLGAIVLIGILLGSLAVAFILKLIFKNNSYLTLYAITTAIAFLAFHYVLYSPTLKIIVPEGYQGKVTLVLSNVKDNILTIDSNGIGYLNRWTFDKTYSIPQVVDKKGANMNNLCVGFNPAVFWGKGTTCCINGQEIETLNFEIVPKEKHRKKQYYAKDLTVIVNKNLVLFVKPDGHQTIDTALLKNNL